MFSAGSLVRSVFPFTFSMFHDNLAEQIREGMVKRLLIVIVLLTASTLHSQTRMPARKLPGGSPTKGYLLPNGWTVTPAGEQIPVGDLPLALDNLFLENHNYAHTHPTSDRFQDVWKNR